jgi:transketolase
MRKQFKQTLLALAEQDERITVVLGDVSVYLLNDFQKLYPRRFYNMGICENTLISVAAGLGSQGLIPFVHTIAPFLTERSFEQIKLDMCYNQFGGNIVTCGASFDYAWDGSTHHAFTDLAILRMLPGCEVLQPGSRKELDSLVRSQYSNGRPTYFRLSDHPHTIDVEVKFGKGVVMREGDFPLTVATAGPLLGNVLEACHDLPVNLLYFHTIKPIDRELVSRFKARPFLVVHDAFGLTEALHEVAGLSVSYHGLPDAFCAWYGKLEDIRKRLGLDVQGIRKRVQEEMRLVER